MRHIDFKSASGEMEEAGRFSRIIDDSRRVIIYSKYTTKNGIHNVRHWLCLQMRNPWCSESKEYPEWTVGGQRYLTKGLLWAEPHKDNKVKYFSTVSVAIKFAVRMNFD